MLERYFPGIAAHYKELDNFWRDNSSDEKRMEFGYFHCIAVNVDMGKPVRSLPHRDFHDLAYGVCAIIAYGTCSCLVNAGVYLCQSGFFPHGLQAWLVNHEAGIAMQLPPLAPCFTRSSVITHYNVDTHGAERDISIQPY